jgi:hypothetical protein
MKKNKKEESKIASLKNSSVKKNKIDSITEKGPIKQKSDKFPKNANEFKHIMDDLSCGVSDIEYMLQLRRNKKIEKVNKDITANSPSFYDDDYKKYKTKHIKKLDEKELMKTNMGTFKYIFSDRTNYAINDTQYKFEVTLRSNSMLNSRNIPKNANTKNNYRWDPAIIPRSRNIFNTILPPVLDKSKEIFNKYGNKIGRPTITIHKDGYINGTKVRSRVFDYNKNIALRYPSEHYPSSKYQNDYGTQNIGSIRHLLDSDNMTMTSFWCTYLRGVKKIKYTMEDTKKREKRLRDKSSEKNYIKI